MSFGFGPNNGGDDSNEPSGQPDFEKMLRNFTQQFGQQFSQEFGLTGANLAPGQAGAQLISTETVRKIAREVSGDGLPIGTNQQKEMKDAIDLANLWLDPEIIFPASLSNSNPAWNMRDWIENSLIGWQKMFEPLAEGMAEALAKVISGPNPQLPLQTNIPVDPNQQNVMRQMLTNILKSFMGSLIATQLGQSVGQLAKTLTGSHDVAIPLFPAPTSHLIPQNVNTWGDGLGLPEQEIQIYLALREVSAARLFAHNPWLSNYIRDAITAYGNGIRIDVESIQRQAEEAMSSGNFDFNNPQSFTIALNNGLFTPEQSPTQEIALLKLETILALIEGWIDHVVSQVAKDRIPSFNALIENSRRKRATNSPVSQLFATLLGLEISPRKSREAAFFWHEVKKLRGNTGRDQRWEDPAFLPTPVNTKTNIFEDVESFLNSTTVPDDLSGLH
jgi:putative hydrolase